MVRHCSAPLFFFSHSHKCVINIASYFAHYFTCQALQRDVMQGNLRRESWNMLVLSLESCSGYEHLPTLSQWVPQPKQGPVSPVPSCSTNLVRLRSLQSIHKETISGFSQSLCITRKNIQEMFTNVFKHQEYTVSYKGPSPLGSVHHTPHGRAQWFWLTSHSLSSGPLGMVTATQNVKNNCLLCQSSAVWYSA